MTADDLIYQQHKVLTQWFSELPAWMEEVADHRKFYTYSMANLLSQGMFLFLSGEASRNAANNRAEHGLFYKSNFSRLFEGMSWAHLDTVDDLFRGLSLETVEEVKTKMIRELIEKKRITSFYGRYLIAIDATGVTTYDEVDRDGELLCRESKSGKKTYLNILLEAKLITPEGLSLSIASEPLSNAEIEAYLKQDCELKGFKRIAKKMKKNFPRLPICLLLDGIYANNTVFDTCEANDWKYIATLKDGCLGLLQQAVTDTTGTDRLCFESPVAVKQGRDLIYVNSHYQCIEGLHHKAHTVNWIEGVCPHPRKKEGEEVERRRFVYLTNLSLGKELSEKQSVIIKIVEAGRLRWKIENEGFNTQKNNGYHLHHKFSRYSVTTLHVYYILMQIAHIINQLVQHSRPVVALLKRHPKLTLRYLWDKLRHLVENCQLSYDRLSRNRTHCQIRLE
ncbi:MAG: hypothetical protein EPN39_10675 [Chitinophagaceae bacterium]|jgi:hypothetical protein|nr:MAG: hypothetical protein EPN39_10675 [Chitinophagaceae bacterium]